MARQRYYYIEKEATVVGMERVSIRALNPDRHSNNEHTLLTLWDISLLDDIIELLEKRGYRRWKASAFEDLRSMLTREDIEVWTATGIREDGSHLMVVMDLADGDVTPTTIWLTMPGDLEGVVAKHTREDCRVVGVIDLSGDVMAQIQHIATVEGLLDA